MTQPGLKDDVVEATLNIKVEMTGNGGLLPLPENLFKPPKNDSVTQILARKADEGLFNVSHPLLAQPSQPITGPSLAQTWEENPAIDGHLMSELFEMANIEYDPEMELAKKKNESRKAHCRPLISPSEGMPH